MINRISWQSAAVTAADEPEPQHERDTSNPDELPPLPRRNSGFTPGQQLGRELLHRIREGDAKAAAAGRTVPRTAAGMRARLATRGGVA